MNWAQAKEVFGVLTELRAEERPGVLSSTVWTDEQTRIEVERLLDAHDRPTVLVEGGVPERFGPFEVRGVIGEGGFATVYRAEQMTPVRRMAAVKVLHGRSATETGAALFGVEQQALATLRHPSIAQLYQCGVDALGRAWFAMELIEGETIDAWAGRLDGDDDSARRVGGVVWQVALALQHAHRWGLLHRDVKPANVLVVRGDEGAAGGERGVLIDFGIAAGSGGSPTGHARAGTPEFMPPEVARGEAATTAADTFGLSRTLAKVLLSLGGARGGVARRLALVAEKGTSPLAEDRYQTAQHLADDVLCVLDGLPATVGRTTIVQRARSAWRASPWVVVCGCAAAVLAGGVFAGSLYGLGKAERARIAAERAQQGAQAAAGLIGQVIAGIDPDVASGRDTTLLTERVAVLLSELDGGVLEHSPQSEAQIRCVAGTALLNLGHGERAADVLSDALSRAERSLPAGDGAVVRLAASASAALLHTGRVRESLAVAARFEPAAARLSDSGQYDEAALLWVAAARAALACGDASHAERWSRAACNAAKAGGSSAQLSEAEITLSEVAAAMGRPSEAVKHARAALAACRAEYGDDHPALARAHNTLGAMLQSVDDGAGALVHQREALLIAERIFPADDARTAAAHANLAVTYQGLGDRPASRLHADRSLEICRRVFRVDHPQLAVALEHGARSRAIDGDWAAAAELARVAFEMRERLAGGRADERVAGAAMTLGRVLINTGSIDEGRAMVERALTELERMAADSPGVRSAPSVRAGALYTAGAAMIEASDFRAGEGYLRQCVELNRGLDPSDGAAGLRDGLVALAICRERLGDSAEAARLRAEADKLGRAQESEAAPGRGTDD